MMYALRSAIPDWDNTPKRVFVRADLNVPLAGATIIDDYRLQALKPTLDALINKESTIILATHIGRPTDHEAALSTQLLVPWFVHHGYAVEYVADLETAYTKSLHNPKTILLLENLRFFAGEKTGDATFAQQLARLADYYVNDAFGVLHRADTSITLLPALFAPERRSIGFLVERELAALNNLLTTPEQPFVLILGGGKVADKIPLLESLLDKVNTVLLCPALVFTFLKAQGKAVGKSLIDDALLPECRLILQRAHDNNVQLLMPIDFIVALDAFNNPVVPEPISMEQFPANGVGISIGPKTVELYARVINNARTIFFNGLIGDTRRSETLDGMNQLLLAVAQSPGLSIVAGGDSVAAAQMLGIADKISYLSTGGGATLTYLSGKRLPGLDIFVQ